MSKAQAIYDIDNMDCPSEEGQIRRRLATMQGVDQLTFDLKQRVLTVSHDLLSVDGLDAALKEIGMNAKRRAPTGP